MNGLVRSFNPVELGPAIWLDKPIREPRQVLRLARQLREHPDDAGVVDIVFAGGGGSCALGLEMYTTIRECGRPTRATIYDAPSMSGVIAMACDRRRIVEGGTIFLHGSGYAAGYLANERPTAHVHAAGLRALARGCDATDAVHAAIIARATGLDPAAVHRLRDAETTLDAAEALQLGFVHSIVEMSACLPGRDARSGLDD